MESKPRHGRSLYSLKLSIQTSRELLSWKRIVLVKGIAIYNCLYIFSGYAIPLKPSLCRTEWTVNVRTFLYFVLTRQLLCSLSHSGWFFSSCKLTVFWKMYYFHNDSVYYSYSFFYLRKEVLVVCNRSIMRLLFFCFL